MTTDSDSTSKGKSHSFWISERWKRTISYLSVSLIVLFVLAVTFQICAMVVNGKNSQIGAGLWCGTLYCATGILGLLAVHRNDKAITIGLKWTAIASIFTSIALVTLAAISLSSPSQGKSDTLWMTSNGILVGVGFLGLFACLSLSVIAARSMSSEKGVPKNDYRIDELQVNTINADVPDKQPSPPSSDAFLEIPEPKPDRSVSLAGSGIYELIESRKDSGIENLHDQNIKESEVTAEPIYARLVKKKESTSSAPSATGDFDIEIDDGRHTNDEKAKTTNTWFEVDQADDPVDSDVDDAELTKNIELPKEDVIIHAPPSDTRSPVL